MKKTIFFAAVLVAILGNSCGKKVKKSAENQAQIAVLQVDDVLQKADSLVNDTVDFEGFCSHLCKHAGKKMFLMGSDDTKMLRVESCELGSFASGSINHNVKVKGVVRETRIDENYLQRWQEQVSAQTSEQHGDSGAGCSTEKRARGEQANSELERIADFRARISQREASEGKAFLSFYHVDAISYEILE